MQGAARNANQVAGLDLDRHDGTLPRMNMEQPASGNDITDFVFIVRMFNAEFSEHRVQPGSIALTSITSAVT